MTGSPLGISHISPQRDARADREWQIRAFDAAQNRSLESRAASNEGRAVALLLEERAETPTLRVWGESRMVKVHVPEKRRGGGMRGKAGCSRASRKRLLEMIHTVDREKAPPQFVTLTFPDFFPSVVDAKRCLDNLFKRMKREMPHVSAIWRLEVIDRKSGKNKGQVAPHFHLLAWGRIESIWLARAWFEVCGESDYAQVKHGTNVKDLDEWAAAVNYCAKDIAKPLQQEVEGIGRVWGVHNRAALPTRECTDVVPITKKVAVVLQRAMRRLQRSRDVLQAQRLTAQAAHPLEDRPAHTAKRAKAAWRRSRRGSFSRTVFTSAPMEWFAWACKL